MMEDLEPIELEQFVLEEIPDGLKDYRFTFPDSGVFNAES